jgi:hypothetical protein
MINIGFFGTFLGSKQNYGTVQTFADIIRIHYGATVVAQPAGGNVQEEDILESIKSCSKLDLAIVCHVDRVRAIDATAYNAAVKAIDQYLLRQNIKCVHLIFERDVPEEWSFSSGPVDFEIPRYHVPSKYRTHASPEESDNCIGIAGNLLAGNTLIKIIDSIL